ncbi:128_t:CDS:2 [Diversispora eburnea]|uniref:128_t:CDS:1 n=1 Tax=Diversispora eburnea TaxID=1213867 RepID=A0A9N8VG05_9GLOM|nr:128_t:CDS:2 [Diversispora eburnea]
MRYVSLFVSDESLITDIYQYKNNDLESGNNPSENNETSSSNIDNVLLMHILLSAM